MICISTRGEAPPIGFTAALTGGVAPDGELYVPQAWPRLSYEAIADFAGRPYAEVAAAILAPFVAADLAEGVIETLCREAYGGFDHRAVAPLVQLAPSTFLLELFHGPSLAFKDIAMQLLARLLDHVLGAAGRSATIVAATSGDTGGAAVEAFARRANITLVVLFPAGRISEVQRRFITTARAANVRAVAIEGDFDDCQAILKGLFADRAFARAADLVAVNSINLARILAQTVYYFTAAAALGAPGRAVSFAVPTGNFGDAYAGHAAAAMGLPIGRIIVATNSNDIVARAVTQGRLARGRATATLSPAMDIQVASNFERLWFDASGADAKATAAALRAFEAKGCVDIPPATLERMRALFRAASVDEALTLSTMRETFEETGVLIDPHTAVALAAARTEREEHPREPMVVLATAHPAKFPEAVAGAIGLEPPAPPRVVRVLGLSERFDSLPAEVEAVKAYVRAAP